MSTSHPQIIILNGPPQSGKDTVGALLEAFTGGYRTKFAKALKDRAHAMLGLRGISHDYFEALKDTQLGVFGSMTPRQFYIYFSEEIVKPIFGSEVFGEILLKEIKPQVAQGRKAIITDCGFHSEVQPLLREYGEDAVELWQIHRQGRSFEGDSRTYIDLGFEGVLTQTILNNHTILDLTRKVGTLLGRIA